MLTSAARQRNPKVRSTGLAAEAYPDSVSRNLASMSVTKYSERRTASLEKRGDCMFLRTRALFVDVILKVLRFK